jgi:type IV pilus assembly protein PilB
MRIGELLVAAKVITQDQLTQALAHPRKEGERLGDVLLGLGMVSDTQLAQCLSQQLAIPWVSLYHVDFSRPLLNLVSQEIADKYCVVPVLIRKIKVPPQAPGAKPTWTDQLFVAMDDPSNDAALEEVAQYCGLTVKPMLAARSDIRAAIRVYYHGIAPTEAVADPPDSQASVEPVRGAAPPPPPSPKPASKPEPVKPHTIPPEDLVDADSVDSPDASPEIEAKEFVPRPKRGPSVPMVALTLLDGTTIQLPQRRGRTSSAPAAEAGSESELTARDLVSALRAVSHGADAAEILGEAPRWEPIVATLLSLMLRKGLIADWEFLEEYRKI